MSDEEPKRIGRPPVDEDRLAAARALYETTPKITMARCATATGLSIRTIERFAALDKWVKCRPKPGEMTAQAQAAADLFKTKMADVGPESVAAPATQDPVVIETAEEQAFRERVTQDVVRDTGIAARAEILDRHRREWAAPRAMSAEAVRLRDTDHDKAFARAKMAKITSETLKIIQDGERKAWGLDVGDLPPGHVVVIERA